MIKIAGIEPHFLFIKKGEKITINLTLYFLFIKKRQKITIWRQTETFWMWVFPTLQEICVGYAAWVDTRFRKQL